MTQVNPEFVERYQLEYQKNPRSKVFAPLAEAYRKMGLIDEALRVAAAGVKLHPDFASGRVAYAKVLLDLQNHEDALDQLLHAAKLSPDNLLAHQLIGETLLELRRPKEALKAFKMVLFINPRDERALAAVRKWEFLTADEYSDELFQVKPRFNDESPSFGTGKDDSEDEAEDNASRDDEFLDPQAARRTSEATLRRQLERALSLADAFTIRNDVESAIEVLKSARRTIGPLPEINNRLTLLLKRALAMSEQAAAATENAMPIEEDVQVLRPISSVQLDEHIKLASVSNAALTSAPPRVAPLAPPILNASPEFIDLMPDSDAGEAPMSDDEDDADDVMMTRIPKVTAEGQPRASLAARILAEKAAAGLATTSESTGRHDRALATDLSPRSSPILTEAQRLHDLLRRISERRS